MLRALTTTVISLCLLALPGAGAWAEEEGLEGGLVNPGYAEKPYWFKQSFLDIREDVEEAGAEGRRVLLYFYQDGCPYCKKLLETNFGQRAISDKTQKHFDVIAINMWGDREVTDFAGETVTEKNFATGLKVMFTPTLLFLDEQGGVVLRLNGYYAPHKFNAALDYVAGRKEAGLSFRDYFAKVSPVAAAGKLHDEPGFIKPVYLLERKPDARPLLVLFEQKDCAVCDELHNDILQRKPSREQLDRLDVVVLDMWSRTPITTPDGRRIEAAKWARELGVKYSPSLVFFDHAGQEVFRTEAYLKSFHIQSAMDYVASGAYREQPNFQRFIAARADALEAQGIHVDLME